MSEGDVKELAQQIIQDEMEDLEEGHSPHKKGTKKYKKHMAAIHANGG